MTITLQIGNSDNKLSQFEWSAFCHELEKAVRSRTPSIWFNGHSHGAAPWQNACWVADIKDGPLVYLREDLRTLAAKFRQESIALTIAIGGTEFMTP